MLSLFRVRTSCLRLGNGAVKANKHGKIESKLAHISFGPDQFRTHKRCLHSKITQIGGPDEHITS